ncbi:uncharacterized protein LOC114944826 [Nylanderia fulva]|uniref:uncharacterized protein LOC114944826 n=1 Tax=Nylanderia fulva TaxID=613905 RepID=UPI0010FB6C54|nr:uncharacterized protein LOC114944826 [Nylanderia fulva]XP_029176712.1 uncharacterized protein LOC114944826 [Nylanderia fulva]
MNDSFLEELEIWNGSTLKQSKKTTEEQVDRHVTTRHATSSPLLEFSEQDEKDNITQPEKKYSITGSTTSNMKTIISKDSSKISKKQADQNIKKLSVNIKEEKIEKIVDNKGKSADIKIKIEPSQSISGEHKIKLQDTRYHKVPENKIANKDRVRRSGSHKETIHSLNTSSKENRRSSDSSNSCDTSSKENNRPSDPSSREVGFHLIKEKGKLLDKSKKSTFKIQDQDPVGLLTAIKELISTYTKQESTKILRAMQDLHINTQAALIKNLLNQTDDLVKEMHPSKDSARMKALIEENERLQQELIALRVQNESLQNKLEEFEFLKQENTVLKLKCHELTQS